MIEKNPGLGAGVGRYLFEHPETEDEVAYISIKSMRPGTLSRIEDVRLEASRDEISLPFRIRVQARW
jgi:hypothetical protein